MKLFTTSTALERLGPTYRIPTQVFSDGTLDSNGILHGSLYLQGGGDPTLGTPGFYNRYLNGLGTDIFDSSHRSAARHQAVTAASMPMTLSLTASAGWPNPATRPAPTSVRSPDFRSIPATAPPLQPVRQRTGEAGGLDPGPLFDQRRNRSLPPGGAAGNSRGQHPVAVVRSPPSTRSSTPPMSIPTTSSPRR